MQGRVPGTDKWKPIQENPDAEEAVPGVLIIRIRESLDFGIAFLPAVSIFSHLCHDFASKYLAVERYAHFGWLYTRPLTHVIAQNDSDG